MRLHGLGNILRRGTSNMIGPTLINLIFTWVAPDWLFEICPAPLPPSVSAVGPTGSRKSLIPVFVYGGFLNYRSKIHQITTADR